MAGRSFFGVPDREFADRERARRGKSVAKRTKRVKLYGLKVSPGLGMGKVCVIGEALKAPRWKITPDQVPQELKRLEEAIARARVELQAIRDDLRERVGKRESDIFDAHLLFLDDPYLREGIEKKVAREHLNVEAALEDVIQESARKLATVKDGYLRERAQDILDVGERLLHHLLGEKQRCLVDEESDLVLVADQLKPANTAHLDRRKIKGVVTERGGPTSHAAILARSLGVPMVTGIRQIVETATLGSLAIVDGYRGQVILNPLSRDIELYRRRQEELALQFAEEEQLKALVSATSDGRRVHLLANIASDEEVDLALAKGAEGIGLYRTEIHFLDREDLPGEDEQFEHYRRVVEKMAPRPVVIRTLDLGGDKMARFFPIPPEDNPYLGLRAIRISLAFPDLFLVQLRALLRAGVYGNLRILLPMVTTVEEVEAARGLLEKAKEQLRSRGQRFAESVPLGAMIEVPSAAVIVRDLLKVVDFLSVGTNDLIQYTLAVDRSNVEVSGLYEALSPAVLRLLADLRTAAEEAGKEIGICGEMAGDTRYTALLVGL
ncbi:MAG TPA: phosphoenolpyruvate--protein phosphotransferase, partial [Bacteroidetes bacterium]|nr:phosphoenolpyruvate--protein phosphotransferase [Bacteroidota bacterium]